jgi:hypothetical protein
LHLTPAEEKISKGENGEAARLAMELVTRLGDIYDADRLVPVASSHTLAHLSSLKQSGIDLFERFASLGGKFSVYTTVDPASVEFGRSDEFGFPRAYVEKQMKLRTAYLAMGGIPSWTCTPYLSCSFPRCGECLAWAESSAVCYANSVIGARTNKIPAGLDVSSAILGLTPNFGLLLPENRFGQVLFEIEKRNLDNLDYSSIGYLLGKITGNRIPVIEGLPRNVSQDQLKTLGAAANASGSVPLFHAVGITPEAMTLERAFGNETPHEIVTLTERELTQAESELNSSVEEPDLIAIGVPHCSLMEIQEIAQLLSGRKVRENIRFWIFTSKYVGKLASEMGLLHRIENAGARLLTTTCGDNLPVGILGIKTILTTSAKMVNALEGEHKVGMRYGSLGECIRIGTVRR